VVAAADGTSEGHAAALTPVLDGMAAGAAGAVLAERIRRILAGERDPGRLTAGVEPAMVPIITAILERLTTDP
jgi:hypothetical protein